MAEEQSEETSGEDLSQVLRHRREKLQALRDRGIEPFAYNFERTASAQEARALFETAESTEALDGAGQGERVRVGGRLVGWRDMGRSVFAHIEDASGRIQLYFRKNVLGEDDFETLGLLDVSDWIGAEGPLFRTRTGGGHGAGRVLDPAEQVPPSASLR